MEAFEFMNKPAITVRNDESIRSVVRKFIDQGISGLPIVNEKSKMVGYISDGDIMRFIGKHKDLFYESFFFVGAIRSEDGGFDERAKEVLDLNVMEIAKKSVVKTNFDTDIEDIAGVLGDKKIKKLPVECDGELVGVISRGDVIRQTFELIL